MVMDELKDALDVHDEAENDGGLEPDLASQRGEKSPDELGEVGQGDDDLEPEEDGPVGDGPNVHAVADLDEEEGHQKLRHHGLRLLHDGGPQRRAPRDHEAQQERAQDERGPDRARHEGRHQDSQEDGHRVGLRHGAAFRCPAGHAMQGALHRRED